jgi:hypothetical protein
MDCPIKPDATPAVIIGLNPMIHRRVRILRTILPIRAA